MFWKRRIEPMTVDTGSIAARLTFWYALLSVIVIAVAGTSLYWGLVQQLHGEDDRLLAGKIAEMRAVVLLHPYDWTALREEVQNEAETLPGIFIRVRSAQAGVIAESSGSHNLFSEHGPFAAVRTPGHGVALSWLAPDGEKYRVMTDGFELGTRYTVNVALHLAREEQFLASYRRVLLLAVAGALGIALGAGYLIARRGLRPVSRLAVIVDGLGAQKLDHRIGEDAWPTELKPLARNFDRLLSRLEESFARISRFSGDIAHELRTPLQILRGEAEIALSREGSNADYRSCIESATDEYDRLSRMVAALLFLARSEQPNAHLDRQSLDVRQEVIAVFDFYQAMADEQGITLACLGEGTIAVDSALLRRALGNLVANALYHTPEGGRITVDIRPQPDHMMAIAVSDTGHGIPPEDLPHVLERFYRADAARPRRGQGAGLGLAIVQSIVHLHGGTISVRSEIGQGTSVTLMFPTTVAAG